MFPLVVVVVVVVVVIVVVVVVVVVVVRVVVVGVVVVVVVVGLVGGLQANKSFIRHNENNNKITIFLRSILKLLICGLKLSFI